MIWYTMSKTAKKGDEAITHPGITHARARRPTRDSPTHTPRQTNLGGHVDPAVAGQVHLPRAPGAHLEAAVDLDVFFRDGFVAGERLLVRRPPLLERPSRRAAVAGLAGKVGYGLVKGWVGAWVGGRVGVWLGCWWAGEWVKT